MANWTTRATGPAAWLLAMAALAPAAAWAQSPCGAETGATRLHVIVEGVRDDMGLMAATLYGDDPEKFLKSHGELKVWFEPVQAPTMDLCVMLPGPGTYAVALYHDENGNHHFDRGLLGPLEGYGFSRNPRVILRPPPLDAVTFDAGEGETTVHVKLRYP
jgi:uncharacterized protein (DUF2141 family)